MAPAATTNGNVRNLDGISNYTKFWQKDSQNDSKTDTDNRLSEYTSVVNGAFEVDRAVGEWPEPH